MFPNTMPKYSYYPTINKKKKKKRKKNTQNTRDEISIGHHVHLMGSIELR